MRDLYLAIDVGTGSLRAALVERRGTILAMSSREHEQIVPQFGWSEQRPADWWAGTVEAIRDVLTRVENAPARVSAICACGQMHGTVLIDADGQLTRETVPLWNDKRTLADVGDFAARHAPGNILRGRPTRQARPGLLSNCAGLRPMTRRPWRPPGPF
ncbi:FGGY family carbohydrate kinase [Paracoccus kondratievae]